MRVLHDNSESAGTFPWVPFGARESFIHTVTVYLGAPA